MITGHHKVEVDGKICTIRFPWSALSEISAVHGDNPNLFSPEVVASVAAIGFREHHPELTAEKIQELSPPLIPFAREIQKALQYAYFGTEGVPQDVEKKSQPKIGLLTRIKQRFGVVLTRNSSGG